MWCIIGLKICWPLNLLWHMISRALFQPPALSCPGWFFFSTHAHVFGSKSEVRIVFREMLWKPHLTWRHAEGTQPRSARLWIICGQEPKGSKVKPQQRESEAARLTYRSGSGYRRGELTQQYFCLAALHHRKWSNRSLTEGTTWKTWLDNKHPLECLARW